MFGSAEAPTTSWNWADDFTLFPSPSQQPDYFNFEPASYTSCDAWYDVSTAALIDDVSAKHGWAMNEALFSYPQELTTPSSPPHSQQSSEPATPPSVNSPEVKPRRRRGRQPSQTVRKSHNEVEQKYRNSVNAAIQGLQRVVPQLSSPDGSEIGDRPQLTKAAILIGATSYIRQLEKDRQKLSEENRLFRGAIIRGNLLSGMVDPGH